jgi:hypothetical protein
MHKYKRQQIDLQFLLFFVSITLSLSCTNQQKVIHQTEKENLVIAKLGKDVISEENETKTHVLYVQKAQGDHPTRSYNYVVERKSDKKIVLEGSFQMGYVKWTTNSSIEVLSLPSLTEQDESKYKKVFSVKSETF